MSVSMWHMRMALEMICLFLHACSILRHTDYATLSSTAQSSFIWLKTRPTFFLELPCTAVLPCACVY